MLGPCDGPPPDAGVTPLGRSVPTAANGSVAPLAPDPSAQLRTIRALRDEDFEVLHLHEPMAPGPCVTALLTGDTPKVGTFHAAGESAAYRHLGWGLKRMARRLDHRCAVSPDAVALAESGSAAPTSSCSTASRWSASRRVRPTPPMGRRCSSSGATSPARASTCCSPPWLTCQSDVRVWVGGDGPQTVELKERYRDESSHRVARPDQRPGALGPDAWLHGVLLAVRARRVLRDGPPRGDGVRLCLVASDLDGHRNVASDGVDALLTPIGDVAALAKALRRVLDDPGLRAELVAGGHRRAEQLSMARLAERYDQIYRQLVPRL